MCYAVTIVDDSTLCISVTDQALEAFLWRAHSYFKAFSQL